MGNEALHILLCLLLSSEDRALVLEARPVEVGGTEARWQA